MLTRIQSSLPTLLAILSLDTKRTRPDLTCLTTELLGRQLSNDRRQAANRLGRLIDHPTDGRHTRLPVDNVTLQAGIDHASTADTRNIGRVGDGGTVLSLLGTGKREGAATARLDIGSSVETFEAELVTRKSTSGTAGVAQEVVGHLTTATSRSATAGLANGDAGRRGAGLAQESPAVARKGACPIATYGGGAGGVAAGRSLRDDLGGGKGGKDGREVDTGWKDRDETSIQPIVDCVDGAHVGGESCAQIGHRGSSNHACGGAQAQTNVSNILDGTYETRGLAVVARVVVRRVVRAVVTRALLHRPARAGLAQMPSTVRGRATSTVAQPVPVTTG